MAREKYTELEEIENRIRTFTWFRHILKKTKTNNVNQLKQLLKKENLFDGDLRIFNYYSPDSKAKKFSKVSGDKIGIISQKLAPSSLEVFKNGPEDSFLFQAMFEDENQFFREAIRRKAIPFKGLTASSYRLGLLNNQDIQKALSFLEITLNEYRKTNTGYLSYSPLALLCLSNSTILFRYLIKRGSYSFTDHYIEDALAIIINIIETEDMKTFLNEYGIRNLFLSWLYIIAINWCSHSYTGDKIIVSTCHGLPSSKAFIKNPKSFLKMILKAQLEYAIRYDYDGGDKAIIEANQFVTEKASKWFPDEENDFIGQLSYLTDSLSSDVYIALTSA